MQLKFKLLPFGSEEQLQTIDLRDEILRKPLGLQFTKAQLADEENQYHLAGYNNDDLVCCLLLIDYDSERMKMRQVAVSNTWQKKGTGSLLVAYSEKVAKEKGKRIMFCNAREVAVPFYKCQGYNIISERFEEVGIPHFTMEKEL